MRRVKLACAALAGVALLSSAALAQRPDEPGQPGERPLGGRPGGSRFSPPIMTALDADKDGAISAEEIENAVAALKGLDKDSDGKLSREEVMGARPTFGGRPGGGAPGGTPGGPGGGAEGFITRLMANDKDGDGKLTSEELPERARGMLERSDANKDGMLDKEELTKAFASFGQNRRPGGGRPGEGRPGRPPGEGGGRPPGDGERPERPRPDAEE